MLPAQYQTFIGINSALLVHINEIGRAEHRCFHASVAGRGSRNVRMPVASGHRDTVCFGGLPCCPGALRLTR
ncbi:hypothetical protein E2C01_006790 [Portunus trituberculatus]|uniref:Uncharacterized protein n=1 Tax=Portunus trituberculatus TaxID=210409 RepID=A0A5B7CW19_PORTR|nr:hypothetical protein [Portunus trituberculatus]